MDINGKASDSSLEVFASQTFPVDSLLVDVVDFLNKSLKRDGYIFGVSKTGDRMMLVIYDTNDNRRSTSET